MKLDIFNLQVSVGTRISPLSVTLVSRLSRAQKLIQSIRGEKEGQRLVIVFRFDGVFARDFLLDRYFQRVKITSFHPSPPEQHGNGNATPQLLSLNKAVVIFPQNAKHLGFFCRCALAPFPNSVANLFAGDLLTRAQAIKDPLPFTAPTDVPPPPVSASPFRRKTLNRDTRCRLETYSSSRDANHVGEEANL